VLLGINATLENVGQEVLELDQCVTRVKYVCLRLVSVSILTSSEAGVDIPSHPSLA
jgi:hypothetical protein